MNTSTTPTATTTTDIAETFTCDGRKFFKNGELSNLVYDIYSWVCWQGKFIPECELFIQWSKSQGQEKGQSCYDFVKKVKELNDKCFQIQNEYSDLLLSQILNSDKRDFRESKITDEYEKTYAKMETKIKKIATDSTSVYQDESDKIHNLVFDFVLSCKITKKI